MEKYNGKLGARSFSSEKPVILFDDYDSSHREFDTTDEAIEAREKESQKSQESQWAILKMIFQFNTEKSEYEIQGDFGRSVRPNGTTGN